MRPTARRVVTAVVVVGVVTAVVVLIAVLAPRWWGGEGGSYAPPELATSARVDPASALFGDVLTAHVSLLVDTRELDPDTIQVYGRFAPYRVLSTTRSVTGGVGRAARVDHVFRLQCLTATCLDAMERTLESGRVMTTPIRFRPARFVAETPDGKERSGEVRWPAVVVRSRLSAADLASETLRPPPFAALEPSYRLSPDLLGWTVVAAAAALALTGGALVTSALRGRVVIPILRIPAHLSGIERALALTRHAAAQGDLAGERRALERLASELRRRGEGELAVAARRLAWSKTEPTDQALDDLVDEVVRTGNGR
jgi:hypothetical protein